MAFDTSAFLSNILGSLGGEGDGFDLDGLMQGIQKHPYNTPNFNPDTPLTPGQSALSEMHSGLHEGAPTPRVGMPYGLGQTERDDITPPTPQIAGTESLTPHPMLSMPQAPDMPGVARDGNAPRMIDLQAGERSSTPSYDRGLTYGEQQKLKEMGRPDLAGLMAPEDGLWVQGTGKMVKTSDALSTMSPDRRKGQEATKFQQTRNLHEDEAQALRDAGIKSTASFVDRSGISPEMETLMRQMSGKGGPPPPRAQGHGQPGGQFNPSDDPYYNPYMNRDEQNPSQYRTSDTNGQPPPPSIRGGQQGRGQQPGQPGQSSNQNPQQPWQYDPNKSPEENTRLEYENTMTQTPKRSLWKDIGAGLIQGFNNAVNPGQAHPIESWGEIKRDRKLRELTPKLQYYEAQNKAQQADDDRIYKRQMESDENLRKQGKNDAEIEKLHSDIQSQAQAIESKKKADELAGKKWEQLEINGELFEKHADGTVTPLIIDGKPAKVLTKVPVHRRLEDGTPVDVTGSQALTSEDARIQADAQRAQQATLHNSDKEFQTQKENISNQMSYNNAVLKTLETVGKANAEIMAAAPELQGLAEQMQAQSQLIGALLEKHNAATDPDEQQTYYKEFMAAKKDFEGMQKSAYAALAKVQGGQQVVQQMKQMMPKAPQTLKYKPVAPVQTKKKVSAASDPLGLFK